MQEMNRDILLSAIRGLPSRKAPQHIWQAVERELPSFPVQDLPLHPAPAATWEGVVARLDRRWSRERILWLVLPLLAVVITGAAILFFNGGNIETQDSGGRMQGVVEKQDPGSVSGAGSQEEPVEERTATITTVPEEEEPDVNEMNMFPEQVPKEDVEVATDNSSRDAQPVKYMNSMFLKNLSWRDPALLLKDADAKFNLEMPGWSTDGQQLDCNFNAPDQSIYTALSLEYQQFLKGRKWEGTRLRSWLSVDATIGYRIDRFIMESGLGFAFSGDLTKIDYSYRQYELVDTYEYVDSIHIDPNTGTVHYYTTTVNVYDSVDHTSETEIKTRYQYVQIPLMVGYEVIRADRWMLDVKAGGAFIAQISRKDKNAMPGHGEARIIVKDPFMQYRKKNFFRLTGSVRFYWWLDKNLRCFAEQSIHYYPRPFYSGQKPVSTGLRVGVIYHF